jgi:hypothetical protein
MLAYPKVRYQKIVHAEQRCKSCGSWFVLKAPEVNLISRDWQANHSIGMNDKFARCQCGYKNSLLQVGEIDHPAKPKRDCRIQTYKFKC